MVQAKGLRASTAHERQEIQLAAPAERAVLAERRYLHLLKSRGTVSETLRFLGTGFFEICRPPCRVSQVAARARPLLRRTSMDEPRDDLRNEDGTVPKWARRVTDTFASNGVQDSKHRDLIDSIEAAEKATNGVFSSKSAGGILDLNAYREMEEEDRAAMNQEQLRRNAEVAQLAALRAEKDRLDEEAARARIKAATDEAMATAPKRKSDANAPFKLVKVAKKKPVAAKEEDDAGGLEGLLGGYGSDDSNDADADQPAQGPPPPPTILTVPPPPPRQPEVAPAGVPGADEYHSDNELDVARAAEARRLRERAEAAEEAEEIAAAMTRREQEALARARVQDIYQQERARRDEEAAERARTHQRIVPEGFERVPEEEREGAKGRNSNERRRGRRSPSSRSRGSESDSPPRRERRHRRSRSRSRSRDRRDDRDRDDSRDRERARRRSRSGSRERRRRSSPRDAEYWTRHYSEKFGLDDGDTGRGGGKGVDEWAKYYEQKYGLSK